MRWARGSAAVCTALVVALVAGCGLEPEDQPTPIPREAVPDDLESSPG